MLLDTDKLTGNFILLAAGKIKLLFSQNEVGQAEYVSADTEWQTLEGSTCFFFSKDHSDTFFVALNEQLKPVTTPFKDRFIVLPFLAGNQEIKWCWQSAQVLTNQTFLLQPLPTFLRVENSPITHFISYKDEIIYPCDTKSLLTFALNEVAL